MNLGLDNSSVLIVGDGEAARLCSHALINEGRGRYCLAGVVPPAEIHSYLRPYARRRRTLRPPHRVVIALDDRRGQLPLGDLVTLRFQGVKVQDASSFLEDLSQKLPLRNVRPSDLVFSDGFRLSRRLRWVKFIWEWLAALALLLVTAPAVALAALAILLETGRPVFFRQVRIGRNGRRFRVLKLRSMVRDAERSGPRFARRKDPRVTPFGRFLRQTRLDEVPQLCNVLRGEMALIGPRPERPEFAEKYQELIPYFNYRHSVRPGITGWAQVMYGYTADVDGSLEKLSYDLFYIKRQSPLLDFEILLRTIKTVLRGDGR